jgi:hypothetical protein
MQRVLGLAACVAVSLACAGCTYRLGDFTALSSKNVPLHYDASTAATGEACKVVFVGLVPYGVPLGPPSLEDAVDRAIGTRGNALVNQVTYTSTYYWVFGLTQCFRVKGDVVTLQ